MNNIMAVAPAAAIFYGQYYLYMPAARYILFNS